MIVETVHDQDKYNHIMLTITYVSSFVALR